jgi:hypothetical protein
MAYLLELLAADHYGRAHLVKGRLRLRPRLRLGLRLRLRLRLMA